MPFVEISRDQPFVSVYLNILVTPDKDVNQSASSTLTAVPPKSALTKNAAIHAQDYVATTQNVELSTILPLVTVLKAILEVRLNPARLSQLKCQDQPNRQFLKSVHHAIHLLVGRTVSVAKWIVDLFVPVKLNISACHPVVDLNAS